MGKHLNVGLLELHTKESGGERVGFSGLCLLEKDETYGRQRKLSKCKVHNMYLS